MRSSRVALVLILIGIFIPLICFPLADGYWPNAGIQENMRSMFLRLTSDEMEPDFRETDSLEGSLQLIKYGDTDTMLGFPLSMSNDEMEAAIKAEKRIQNTERPKNMRFYGWRITYKGARIPFRYVVSLGFSLTLAGLMIITLKLKAKAS